ncbi:hypothetical protein CLOM_g4705 [Closterium sp. NIES-68]|nr:hypothetical protein CLOM_g4705 [Closterium sp. NIES-68]GJP57982.1 hypothetical protein CLOP_g19898 [Closterium sp. NIES-67]
MNVGDVKGAILDDAVRRANPLSALELDAFCGYSAVRIASRFSKPGARLVSVELSDLRSSVVRSVVAHAGLSDKVTVVTGTLQTSTDEIRQAPLPTKPLFSQRPEAHRTRNYHCG